jgi:hypothetical protein
LKPLLGARSFKIVMACWLGFDRNWAGRSGSAEEDDYFYKDRSALVRAATLRIAAGCSSWF